MPGNRHSRNTTICTCAGMHEAHTACPSAHQRRCTCTLSSITSITLATPPEPQSTQWSCACGVHAGRRNCACMAAQSHVSSMERLHHVLQRRSQVPYMQVPKCYSWGTRSQRNNQNHILVLPGILGRRTLRHYCRSSYGRVPGCQLPVAAKPCAPRGGWPRAVALAPSTLDGRLQRACQRACGLGTPTNHGDASAPATLCGQAPGAHWSGLHAAAAGPQHPPLTRRCCLSWQASPAERGRSPLLHTAACRDHTTAALPRRP